ncbi:type II toxin-antitoxin system Phd/YefM family antitoxin [Aeromicrobium sp. CnD17-E]|uniref:type II toxin-antitoxin system Phd/YefM family antitoxin n=1 Tax=Aeromicrobium sp. CnD17-E TaxID=2954487 RepID=UPI002096C46B|nr:type II toxin-antitoxin system prevent-host-death family antitoxin [Aeromicrobium sp. CnD17-E]MCO7239228.1 type II toxin-antitoxin system prevent-host-death family antitoxin [Aeromicrobium sp. CnD17-E]
MAITASEARRELFPLIKTINEDRVPVEVTSKHGSVTVMATEDYDAWVETAYLFRSPANARRLLDAADAARGGDVERHGLVD